MANNTLLFIISCAPRAGINAQESLDALLMGSAFASCSALFVGDGLKQLLTGQELQDLAGGLPQRNFAKAFPALNDYGVEKIHCSQVDLDTTGLNTEQLVIEIEPLSDNAIAKLIVEHDVVLNF